MERAVFVYTTYPSLVEAERAGRALVERRLRACVNILPGMISHYWWQGAIERGEEVVMIIKTRASLWPRRCAPPSRRCTPTPRRRSWCCRSRASIRTITPGSWRRRSERNSAQRATRRRTFDRVEAFSAHPAQAVCGKAGYREIQTIPRHSGRGRRPRARNPYSLIVVMDSGSLRSLSSGRPLGPDPSARPRND